MRFRHLPFSLLVASMVLVPVKMQRQSRASVFGFGWRYHTDLRFVFFFFLWRCNTVLSRIFLFLWRCNTGLGFVLFWFRWWCDTGVGHVFFGSDDDEVAVSGLKFLVPLKMQYRSDAWIFCSGEDAIPVSGMYFICSSEDAISVSGLYCFSYRWRCDTGLGLVFFSFDDDAIAVSGLYFWFWWWCNKGLGLVFFLVLMMMR